MYTKCSHMDNAVMEMTSSEIRLKNTQFVINEFYNGTRRALAVALGKEPNTVSRWFKRKAIGDASVRLIEDKHEYPRGWMDTPHPELWGGDIDLSVSETFTPKSNTNDTALDDQLDLSGLISVATPNTKKLLEELSIAIDSGQITEDEMNDLMAIAKRLIDKKHL